MADYPPEILLAPWQPFILTGSDTKKHRDTAEFRPHQGYSLFQILDGGIQVSRQNSEWKRLPGRRCYLMSPHSEHIIRIVPESRYRRLAFSLTWGPRCLPSGTELNCLDRPSPSLIPSDGRTSPAEHLFGCSFPLEIPKDIQLSAKRCVTQCCSLWWRDRRSRLRANLTLGWFLLDLAEALIGEAPGLSNTHPLGEMEYHIRARLGQGIDVNQLAELLQIDRTQLYRRCRHHAGCSPRQLIDRIRLETATELLRHQRLSIQQVGQACGYAHLPSFSRWFAQQTGQSAKQFSLNPSIIKTQDDASESDPLLKTL